VTSKQLEVVSKETKHLTVYDLVLLFDGKVEQSHFQFEAEVASLKYPIRHSTQTRRRLNGIDS